MLGIYIKLEDNKKAINYMSIGQMVKDKFNGIVYNYQEGGTYLDWYVYQDKYLPTSFSDNEAVDNDTAAKWLNSLVKDNNFVKSCYEKMSEYTIFEVEHLIKDEKLMYFENNCYSKSINIASKIVTNNDTAEYYSWDEFAGLFDWKSLIKDCFEHQIIINEKGELSSSEIICEAVHALIEDDVYCGLFSRDKVKEYITQIVKEIESRNGIGEESNLFNINIQECDVCVDCGSVALPDDELYTKYNGDALCASCSFLCEGCEQYFTEEEMYFNKYGIEGCKKCIEKGKQKALKEFDVYATRNEQYHAKVAATTEEEAKMLANEDYCNYDFIQVDGTLDTTIDCLDDEPQYLYRLTRYDNWFSLDSLENFGVFTSKERAIEAIKNNIGPVNNGDESSFCWNGENQLMSNDMGSFQIDKIELDCFGEC